MLRLAFKRRSVLRARINPEKVLTVDSIHTKISLIPDRYQEISFIVWHLREVEDSEKMEENKN